MTWEKAICGSAGCVCRVRSESHAFSPRPIERRLEWVFYKMEMKIWAVGCGLGWTVLKKVWADYEQLLRVGFSNFCGQKKKKNFENIVATLLKSCIEKR